MAKNAREETTILFILMGFKVLGKIEKIKIKSSDNIFDLVNQSIQKKFVKKPGQRIFLDYRLDISADSIEVFPKNLFTALLFSGYNTHFTLDFSFKIWKNFIISYGPSCTGFFLA